MTVHPCTNSKSPASSGAFFVRILKGFEPHSHLGLRLCGEKPLRAVLSRQCRAASRVRPDVFHRAITARSLANIAGGTDRPIANWLGWGNECLAGLLRCGTSRRTPRSAAGDLAAAGNTDLVVSNAKRTSRSGGPAQRLSGVRSTSASTSRFAHCSTGRPVIFLT
jgi:hypothetical protein